MIAVRRVQVVEIERDAAVGFRGNDNDARGCRGLQNRQQQQRQQEIAQVVERKRHLAALGAFLPLAEHGAGIVDEHVKPPMPVGERCGQAADRGVVGKVGLQEVNVVVSGLGTNGRQGGLSTHGIAADDGDACPALRECPRGDAADAGASAADKADLAAETASVRCHAALPSSVVRASAIQLTVPLVLPRRKVLDRCARVPLLVPARERLAAAAAAARSTCKRGQDGRKAPAAVSIG